MKLEDAKKTFEFIFSELNKIIVGQNEVLKEVCCALLADSHALLEGYPGVAKTLTIKSLSEAMDLKFSRIQNTPDLMPSDITGTYIIEEATTGKRNFKFQPGPVFANIVLADEINRATPKTQSALLEAMQEHQVTVGNTTFKLEEPFFVLATQNPIEQEGSLAIDQTVFVNGQLKTGKELLALAQDNCVAEDKKGVRLYDMNAYTLTLNPSGKLEKQKCQLYTLPYKDEMIALTTQTGKKIVVTKNHPLLVNDQGRIMWKKAEELTKQDYLINPAKISVEPQTIISHEQTLSRMNCEMPEIPFDTDFAFWIAFLLSDGSIGTKYVEAVQKNYPEALDRFALISRKYGFKCSVRMGKGGCRYARIYSKRLVEYLRIRFGVTGGKNKEIPSWFLSFPDEMNREFLRTFISLESFVEAGRIVFTQKPANNINIISHMLLREGILSWVKHDGRVFRLKIQGRDFSGFLRIIGGISDKKIKGFDLERTAKSSFRVVPVERNAVLKLVDILGLNSFHTLKGRKNITSRKWYGSYKGIKEGEAVMSVDAFRTFVNDIRTEINFRKTPEFAKGLENSPREFAAGIGTPMTDVAQQLEISKNQAWKFYSGNTGCVQIKEFLQEKYTLCIVEADKLLAYCEALLSEDVYYDKIKAIKYAPYDGLAFGLTVPEGQNYIAGFGACGINHNTYPLPEAQADRFLFKIKVDYPSFDEEVEIVNRYAEEHKRQALKPVLNKDSLLYLQHMTRMIPIANDIKKYAVQLVTSTRQKKNLIEYGASPRASIGIILAAKARALIEGRKFVSKDDINRMAFPVLRHRLVLSFEAERQGMHADDVIKTLIK